MDLVSAALLFGVGSLVGFLSGLLGVGGGFILVPVLLSLGIPHGIAVGTSFGFIIATAISGSIKHLRQGTADPMLASVMLPLGVVATQLGAVTTTMLSLRMFSILFIPLLLGSVLVLAVRKKAAIGNGVSNQTMRYMLHRNSPFGSYHVSIVRALAAGGAVGFVSGLFGVGGGFIMVPIMAVYLAVPLHVAIGTSLMQVTILASSALVGHWILGNVDILSMIAMALGGVTFAPLGARTGRRARASFLRKMFVLLLVAAAARMLMLAVGI